MAVKGQLCSGSLPKDRKMQSQRTEFLTANSAPVLLGGMSSKCSNVCKCYQRGRSQCSLV